MFAFSRFASLNALLRAISFNNKIQNITFQKMYIYIKLFREIKRQKGDFDILLLNYQMSLSSSLKN